MLGKCSNIYVHLSCVYSHRFTAHLYFFHWISTLYQSKKIRALFKAVSKTVDVQVTWVYLKFVFQNVTDALHRSWPNGYEIDVTTRAELHREWCSEFVGEWLNIKYCCVGNIVDININWIFDKISKRICFLSHRNEQLGSFSKLSAWKGGSCVHISKEMFSCKSCNWVLKWTMNIEKTDKNGR